jgi:hypothetical protein
MRSARSSSWAAWVTSAVLHALIAVLVVRAGNRAPRPPEPEPQVVELDFEVRDPSPLPSPRQAGRGDERQAGRGDKKRASAPSPSSAPSPRSAPSSSSAVPDAPAPGPVDRAEAGGDHGAPRVDLSFGALPDEIKGRFKGAPPPEGTLRARPGRLSVDELRVELERHQDAVANVEAGRVDPLLYEYLRGARSRFQADAKRLADGLPLGPGATVRGWGRGYLKSVDDVNRGVTGARADRPPEAGGDTRNEISPGADVLGQYREAGRQAEAGAEERSAEVCVDVAAGRESAVSLRRSSGNAALDRLTIESFTKSIAARPVPPDARRGLACYELRISAFRMPPLPFVSCGFDIGFSGVTCVWPYKKVTSVKGRLLSVDYPPTDGEKARPSLLRKPR